MFPGRIILLAPNLARPRPAAPPGASTRPARGMSGFWIRQVSCLNRISLVRAYGETFKRRIFDAFGECEEGLFPRRTVLLVTVLPDPAPPPRRALRRDPPVVCPGFGLDKFLSSQKCVGSAAEFSWPLGGITGFRDQGNLVRKNQKKASVIS